jgi:eukaryotic-like serine/threonine-protein kinase
VVPSASTLVKGTSDSIRPQSYILRSGRAMLYPVFKGTYERYGGRNSYQPVEIRDAVVAWRKDVRWSLDYLETRKDIDVRKIGYIGCSLGSEVAPMLLSMERRFAAAALLSGGLAPAFGRLPEVNAVNFLPRVRTPVLMVNGKYDSILPAATAQEPMFQQLGTPTADKRRIIVDSGHSVMTPETQNALIKAVLDWFDKYL